MGDFFGNLTGGGGGEDVQDEIIAASTEQAEAQREGLEYLKEREKLPTEVRDVALLGLQKEFKGIERPDISQTDAVSQQRMVDKARGSPLFAAIMGGREAGEESIARTASATGGLRSGGTQEAFYDYNVELENQALVSAYNEQRALDESQYEKEFQQYSQQIGGLQGLAQLPSSANAIAAMTGGIGQTLAQGKIAALQSGQVSQQQGTQNMMGMANLGLQAYSAFSDIRLKDNVEFLEERNGHRYYKWDWNEEAEKLGLHGETEGVMAHELVEYMPQAIGAKDGYITVAYDMLEAA